VTDAHSRAVCEALQAPGCTATSLDLSGNALSDAGASLLAAALAQGAAPDLISLSVSDNAAVTETGRAALQSAQKLRRGLAVQFAPLPPPPPPPPPAPPSPPPSAAAGGPKTPPRPGPGSPSKPAAGAAKSLFSLASRYFGGGGGTNSSAADGGWDGAAAEPAASAEPACDARIAPLEAAHEALHAASAAVAAVAAGDADALRPPQLAAALFTACAAIDAELDVDAADAAAAAGLDHSPPPRLGYARMSDLPPATLTLAQAAEMLAAVLTLAPPPLPWQGGAGLRPGLGTHRLAALRLLSRLVQLRCAEVDCVLAGCSLLPRALDILFAHPCSSPAQVAIAELLREALRSPHAPLWRPLFAPPAGGGASLQARLAEAATAAAVTTPGLRSPLAGAVLAFANGVAAMQAGEGAEEEEGPAACEVRSLLASDADWAAFCAHPLAALNAEQAGGLCGPRPARPSPFATAARGGAAARAAGAMPSFLGTRELLSMLRFLPS